jgi:hypothetical protein
MASSPMVPGVEINLRLVIPRYVINRGHILIFSGGVAPNLLALPSGEQIHLTRRDQDVAAVDIRAGVSGIFRILHAGTYSAMIADIELMRLRDNEVFRVPMLAVREFTITEDDLHTGSASLELGASDLIRVRVLDKAGNPVSSRQVEFFNREARYSFHATTDARGDVFAFGAEGDYLITLSPGQDESLKVEVSSTM